MKAHGSAVKVFARIRPTANVARGLIECLPDGETVNICLRKDSRKPQNSRKNQWNSRTFRLEGVLKDVSQEEFYARVCQRVVLGALDGYNGTVMCFGQTGAGKTYTMTGSTESYRQRGIIPRALQEVFQEVEKRTEQAFFVHLSYLEIYNETLVDLLSPLQGSLHPPSPSMVVMEEPGRGVFIRGLSLHTVHSEEEALNLLFEGEMNRIIGSHGLNRNSSRSHCILTLQIVCHSRTLSDAKYVTSKLNLVDLAGSERLGKTGSKGQTLKEAVYINRSLSFLEQTILALADRGREHVPFRQSKLTHVLKDSLGGNCNTVLVANIYGEAAQIEETVSTLRFASRMKCVQTDPAVNEHMDPAAQIKKLEEDVQKLKEELSLCKTLVKQPSITDKPLSEAQLAEISSQVQRYLEGSLEEISITSIRQVQAAFAQFKLVVQEQEQKVKAQLCRTYDLVQKSPSANAAAVEASGQHLEWENRGHTEDVEAGSSGGPGDQLPRNLHPSTKAKMKKSEGKERSHPPKEEAFEDFKKGQGNEINCIFAENKAVLLERRSLLQQLTEEVSGIKREIDLTTTTIQQHKELRGGQGPYLVMEGKPVLEPDVISLMQLRELKTLYCQRHKVLRDMKAEVNYCQHLVDQCRVRLLSEFEDWYEKCLLAPEEDLDVSAGRVVREEKKVGSRLLPDNHSSSSSHNACHKTLTGKTGAGLYFATEELTQSKKTSSN